MDKSSSKPIGMADFYRSLAKDQESEVRLYALALELTRKQLQQEQENPNPNGFGESSMDSLLSVQEESLKKLLAQAEESYFNTCADLWMAESIKE